MRSLIAILALVALAGCEGAGARAVDTGRKVKNEEAVVAVNAQCAVGVGALQRTFTEEVQKGVWDTCAVLNSGAGVSATPLPSNELVFAEPVGSQPLE